MKTICFFLSVLLVAIGAFAQDGNFIASGKVIDSASGQPLSGASIFARNTTLGTLSNAEGSFKLGLPRGGYDLVVSYTGYETEEIHINATSASDISFALKQKDKSLSEFTVSGSNEVADGLEKIRSIFYQQLYRNYSECCTV